MRARFGGAIYFDQSLNSMQALYDLYKGDKQTSAMLSQLNITDCSAEFDGGAFYLRDPVNMKISDSTIKGCFAGTKVARGYPTGEGGGIFYQCSILESASVKSTDLQCDLALSKVVFEENKAKIGGAIRWTYKEPSMGSAQLRKTSLTEEIKFGTLTFVNNTAVEYGPEIASMVQRLIRFTSEEQYLSYFDQSSPTRQLPVEYLVGRAPAWYAKDMFYGVQSGGYITARYYGLVDMYNQIVSINQGKEIKLSIINRESRLNSEFPPPSLVGVTSFFSAYGTYNMSGMALTTGPGEKIYATLEILAVDVSIPSNAKYLRKQMAKQVLSTNDYTVSFTMIVRNCTIGEGLLESGACFRCPQGTFLLEAPEVATPCKACPLDKAFCEGGSNIGPKPGYWRSSNTSDTFYECFTKGACLGMLHSGEPNITEEARAVGVCNTTAGYYGALCSACLPGFKR